MDFEQIEICAIRGEELDARLSLPEMECFIVLSDLYRRYRCGITAKEDAGREKRKIRTAYEQAKREYVSRSCAYAQYQEDIRNAGTLRQELIRASNAGASDREKLSIALKIITAMTGEDLTERTVMGR